MMMREIGIFGKGIDGGKRKGIHHMLFNRVIYVYIYIYIKYFLVGGRCGLYGELL
jgi:hypothetical protein